MTIILDAGHGGNDSGATANGRLEKNDTLTIAQKVGHHLMQSGIMVILTRGEDKTVKLEDRPALANSNNADYLISFHRNAGGGTGAETWIHSNNVKADRDLAESIQRKLAVFFRDRGVKTGMPARPKDNFAINRLSNMPSCLVEIGFIDTPADNEILDNRNEEICSDIARGICESVGKGFYCGAQNQQPPQPQTPPVQQAPQKKQIKVNKGTWNVRQSPSNDGRILKTVTGGMVFDCHGVENGWYKIDGGYIGRKGVIEL